MTMNELYRLKDLRKEVADLKNRIERLEGRATRTGTAPSGMPFGGGITDKTGTGADLADLRDELTRAEAAAQAELLKLLAYIRSVDDPFIRNAMRYRFVDCLSWSAVAWRIGGNNTGDGVRMAVKRYVQLCG